MSQTLFKRLKTEFLSHTFTSQTTPVMYKKFDEVITIFNNYKLYGLFLFLEFRIIYFSTIINTTYVKQPRLQNKYFFNLLTTSVNRISISILMLHNIAFIKVYLNKCGQKSWQWAVSWARPETAVQARRLPAERHIVVWYNFMWELGIVRWTILNVVIFKRSVY